MFWDATNFLWKLQTSKGFFVIFIDATTSTIKDVDIYVILLLRQRLYEDRLKLYSNLSDKKV